MIDEQKFSLNTAFAPLCYTLKKVEGIAALIPKNSLYCSNNPGICSVGSVNEFVSQVGDGSAQSN